jgi:tetratricopeptide (TPR) repeat protein
MKDETELLEQYLSGQMAESDRLRLEERLRDEPELQQTLAELKLMVQGLTRAGRKEVHAILKQLDDTLPPVEARVVPLWRKTWLQVAASLSILALCAYLLWPRPADPKELFAEYFEPYPNVIMPTVRGDLKGDTALKARAYKAYDLENYKEAIALFEEVDQKDEGVLLYLGNAYLANGDAARAIRLFEKVIAEYEVFDEQAEWYLALAWLRGGDKEEAVKTLGQIESEGGHHSASAKKILLDLNP